LNLSLTGTGIFLSVKKTSNAENQPYTTLKGAKKMFFKQTFHRYLVFENELYFYSQAPPSIQVSGK